MLNQIWCVEMEMYKSQYLWQKFETDNINEKDFAGFKSKEVCLLITLLIFVVLFYWLFRSFHILCMYICYLRLCTENIPHSFCCPIKQKNRCPITTLDGTSLHIVLICFLCTICNYNNVKAFCNNIYSCRSKAFYNFHFVVARDFLLLVHKKKHYMVGLHDLLFFIIPCRCEVPSLDIFSIIAPFTLFFIFLGWTKSVMQHIVVHPIFAVEQRGAFSFLKDLN